MKAAVQERDSYCTEKSININNKHHKSRNLKAEKGSFIEEDY